MNLLNSQNQKNYSSKVPKHNKKRLTEDQVRLLEASFNSNNKLEPETKLELSHQLCIPPRQIAIWYQNRRARLKNQSLELDYNELQRRLEDALTEKRKLERDVGSLREELYKTQQVLIALRPAATLPSVSSLSSFCDEGGNSSCSWVNDENLKLEEIYACFMDGYGSNCA